MSRTALANALWLGLFSVAFAARADEAPLASRTVKVMSYNLQNLFDTVDNPDTNDQDFLPKGAQAWTESVLKDKMRNLGEVISAQNPDILGVVEIENQLVIDRLNKEALKGAYQTVIAGPSDDARGIRNGVLSKYPTESIRTHRVWKDTWREGNGPVTKTRDILEVTLRTGAPGEAGLITVLVNHWPSRGGGPIRVQYRKEAAQAMKLVTEEILRKNPGRLVVSIGDFNDGLADKSFTEDLKLVEKESDLFDAGVGSFFPLDALLPEDQKGTFYYHVDKVWNDLDHILLAKGSDLAAGRVPGFGYRDGSVQVVRPAKFMDGQGIPRGCELHGPELKLPLDKKRKNCANGAADHLALTAILELR
jgi:predicted extracellular nuclease